MEWWNVYDFYFLHNNLFTFWSRKHLKLKNKQIKQNRKQNKTKLSLKTTAAKAQKKTTKAGGLKKNNKQQPNKKQPNNPLNCKEGLYSLEAEILSWASNK